MEQITFGCYPTPPLTVQTLLHGHALHRHALHHFIQESRDFSVHHALHSSAGNTLLATLKRTVVIRILQQYTIHCTCSGRLPELERLFEEDLNLP